MEENKGSSRNFGMNNIPDLTGGEILEEDSDYDSCSDTPSLKKRKPKKFKRPANIVKSSSKTENTKILMQRGLQKQNLIKSATLDSRLNGLLHSILSLPTNTDSHLTQVLETLTAIDNEMDSLQKKKQNPSLFSSQVGKYLVVIRRIIGETYKDHKMASTICQKVVQMMNKACKIILLKVVSN